MHALSFKVELLEAFAQGAYEHPAQEGPTKQRLSKEDCGRQAAGLCGELAELDSVRRSYWVFRAKALLAVGSTRKSGDSEETKQSSD